MQDYLLQFEGDEHHGGTRYKALLVGPHQCSGVVFNCLSIHEALGRASSYWQKERNHGVADTVVVKSTFRLPDYPAEELEVLRMSIVDCLRDYPPLPE